MHFRNPLVRPNPLTFPYLANGACCPDSDRCCENSCTKPGGACCANGRSCRAGYGCCDLLNIGNDDCVPLGSSCCRGGGFCKAGWGCCNDSIDGCAPLDGECCIGYGYCTKGYQCVLHRGLLSCCPGGICFGSDNDNGQTLTSQPPSEGDSADEPAPTDTTEETEIAHDDAIDDLLTSAQANEPSPTQPPADSAEAPIPTEEPRATLEQTETVKDITNKYLSISVQGDETSSTTNSRFDQPLALPSFPFPSSELAFLSSELAFLSISIPSISVPSVNVPSISVPSVNVPSPPTPKPPRPPQPNPNPTTRHEKAAPASMGSPKIQTASWAAVMTGVVAVFFVVGATLGI